MYKFTDLSLRQLTLLRDLVCKEINEKSSRVYDIQKYFPDSGYAKDQLIESAEEGLTDLEDLNVIIRTSIDMVQESHTIQSN